MSVPSFLMHFVYIAIFFLLGLFAGWYTYPRFIKLVRKRLFDINTLNAINKHNSGVNNKTFKSVDDLMSDLNDDLD